MNRLSLVPLFALAASATPGASGAQVVSNETVRVDVGAEVRLRYDVTDNLPNDKRGEADDSNYARVRIRPWARLSFAEDYGLL